ncbi:uncharacterized protein METZ01_LOCUS380460, partial [marine metagenome]
VDLVQKYLVDNPDAFLDQENYENEFIKELSKCASTQEICWLIDEWTGYEEHDVWKRLDYSKCTTTQEQLDSATRWDEDLNWLGGWLADHALPEWNHVYIDELRKCIDSFMPKWIPIGAFDEITEDEWYRQNKKPPSSGISMMDAQSFIKKSIFSWIYQNPDLIDLKGKALGRNIVEIVTNEESLTGWAKKLCEWADNLPKSKSFFGGSDLPRNNDDLTNLDTLTLRGEKITELPKEIGNLTKLTYLKLSSNKLTKLPKEIGNLTNLQTLILYDNKITKLPKEIGNLTKLTYLKLSGN